MNYAIVPREPTEEMRLAAWLVTGADPVCDDSQMSAVLAGAIEAAPPPPEKVLDKTDIARIFREIYGATRYRESELLFAQAIERAVLKQLGAKNV